ncbi:MAG TPA: hypothetical protein VKZ53_18970 [Candidatus Angelobacter sp.]|nr:hypothetical protein [Candidatus Angelobacter sp.]
MIRISTLIWAGVFCLALMPLTTVASEKNDAANKDREANAAAAAPASPTGINAAGDPLLRLLATKGILSASDLNALTIVPAAEMRDKLLLLLKDKGVLSAADLSMLKPAVPAGAGIEPVAQPGAAALAATTVTAQQQSGPPQTPPLPGTEPIPAVAPVRVMQINPPKREGVLPAISIGKNIHIQPYGFFKATSVYDTASPYGNDFPLPGFIGDINGPDKMSEFHIKARSLRIGSNFEWMDSSSSVIVTGKLEADFEGNFSRVNNRNISSIRSSAPQIRVGYGRVDYKATDSTTLNFLAGQDWTLFGSSTLPNLLETTGLGIGFGTLYERDPQFRFGVNHKFSDNFSLEPDFAVVLPAYGNLPADILTGGPADADVAANNEGLGNQLGFGERQGVDSGRPELQARLVAQFQLDHAAGVAPAQLIVSGVDSERDVVVLASAVPTAFKAAFPTGARINSKRHAWTAEVQLPTRFATLTAKYYNGSDLRYYFAGQILGPFSDNTGLTNTATAQSIDGSTTAVFGLRNGVPVIANSLPPRSQGGFVNLGLPISRWANADPKGRNAGWQMYVHYGYDQVLARDVRREGGGRMKGDMLAGTIYYKLNPWLTFAAEESLYRTRAIPLTATGQFPLFQGRPMRELNDVRTEIGPLFTF